MAIAIEHLADDEHPINSPVSPILSILSGEDEEVGADAKE